MYYTVEDIFFLQVSRQKQNTVLHKMRNNYLSLSLKNFNQISLTISVRRLTYNLNCRCPKYRVLSKISQQNIPELYQIIFNQ